ncbi:MAG: SufE family protein [Caulobacteraceae bacterium]|nr:SufE family protein [Caulobacter sp.]
MASRPDAALDELADEFDVLGDWEERYRHLIDLGRGLEPLTEAEHSDANKVRGCASQVWLVSEPTADGRLMLRGDSDAHLVKGLVAVVIRLFSGAGAAEIAAFDAPAGFARLGLAGALSAQRANGLAAMVARIKSTANAA